jgi:Holliday junction resolvase RusA-like endonuclease
MSQRFIIHSDLPGLNELIDARIRQGQARGRRGARWNAYSDLKRHWMEELVPLARAQLRPVTERVVVNIHFFEANRRRDPDNIMTGAVKFILDALVEAGIIPNDGWKNIGELRARFHVSSSPRVDVFLEEAA